MAGGAAAYDVYDGATEPLWFGDRRVWSVTGFVLGVRSRITDIPTLWVQGEISELKVPKHLATAFFTLKDPENGYMVSCTMPRSRLESLRLDLRDGDLVQCFGRADIHAPRGSFQLRVQSLERAGRGLIMQQLEALTERLAAEGLFDESRKRSLPLVPRRVGVITGAGAAAQGDFLRNVTERFPAVKLVMIETLVQGDRAAPQLVAALHRMQRVPDVDVIVVTRGGGAFEDFLPFSDERVVRAIAASRIPVVSAIGHEKDSPISDLVADLRVSTPTAAARTVVPDQAAVEEWLARTQRMLRARIGDAVDRRRERILSVRRRLDERSPQRVVDDRVRWITGLRDRIRTAGHARIDAAHAGLARDRRDLHAALRARVTAARGRSDVAVARLRALSPRATIERGYAVVRRVDGAVVRRTADAPAGTAVTIVVGDGELHAGVKRTTDATTPASATNERGAVPDDE